MRLIDADALIEKLESEAKHMDKIVGKMFTYFAIDDLKKAPTVDAVPVIRCRECTWYHPWDKRGGV